MSNIVLQVISCFLPFTPVFFLLITRKVVNTMSVFAGAWPDLTQLIESPQSPLLVFPTGSLLSPPPGHSAYASSLPRESLVSRTQLPQLG